MGQGGRLVEYEPKIPYLERSAEWNACQQLGIITEALHPVCPGWAEMPILAIFLVRPLFEGTALTRPPV
jgi:hypothetical protein